MSPKVVGLALGLVLMVGCGSDAERSTATPSTPPPTFVTTAPTFAPTFAPTTVPPTSSAQTPTPATVIGEPEPSVPLVGAGDGASLLAALDTLTVADEVQVETYDRDLFGGAWIDADGNGCDTRCEVLAAQRKILPGGQNGWLSVYDNYPITTEAELDIDHVVPLAEAWRSGAWAWDPNRRIAFANDLDETRALVAVTAVTNRSKSDSDPAGWKPASASAWCGYVDAWISVKQKWNLTADLAEVAALRSMVAAQTC